METCTRCCEGEFKYFCTCDPSSRLCHGCAQTHFVSILGVNHFLLPCAAYGPHRNPGYHDRVMTRIHSKEQGMSEINQNINLIENCKNELKVHVEEMITQLQNYYSRTLQQLNEVKEKVNGEVMDAVMELENCIYMDKMGVGKPIAKWLNDYRPGCTLQLFRYSFNTALVSSMLSSLLRFDRLPIDTEQRSSETLPSPKEPSDTTDDLVSGYFCPVCKQNIKHRYRLKDHFNLHIKEYLYKCPLCECCFMRKNLFKAHIQVSHPEESVRKVMYKSLEFEPKCTPPLDLQCLFCDSPIKTKETLYEHSELHSEKYPCPLCTFSEVEIKQLECHIKRHLKETRANYQCTICSNKYVHLSTVKKHIDSAHQGMSIDAGFKETHVNLALVCQFCGEVMATLVQILRHAEDHSRLGMEVKKKAKSVEEEESRTESEEL